MPLSSDDRRTLLLSGTGLGWIFSVVLAAMAWQDYSHYTILQSPTARMRLSDLVKRESIEARHVTLTDFTFGDGYAYETGAAVWVSVSVPVFPKPDLDAPIAKPDRILAIVEAWDIQNEDQFQKVLRQEELTGVLSRQPYWPGATRGPLLTEANPGMTIDKVWGLHIFRNYAQITTIRFTTGGAIVCMLLGTVCIVIRRRDVRTQSAAGFSQEDTRSASETSAPGDGR